MILRSAICVALLCSGCTGASSTGIDPMSCPPEGTLLTYVNFGKPLIDRTCVKAGCHDHRQPVLTTQSAIQQYTSQILDEAVYTDAMPESGDMALAEREQLGEWLACGAP